MTTKLSELSSSLNAKQQGADVVFEMVSIDTRTLKPGDLFVAIRGENFDGHNFVEQAKAQGAVAAVVDQPVAVNLPTLQVADTRSALGKIAASHRDKFPLPIIALTGSCGKTTVKEMIHSILMQVGTVLANRGTLNNDIGVPLTLLKLNATHRYAVIELGANHMGEIAYLTQMVKPKVAFINNIAPAHLEGFGSIEGVAKAKSEIFQGLNKDGVAAVNMDDDFAAWLQKEILAGRTIHRFGIKNKSVDVSAREIKTDAKGYCEFILKTPIGEVDIHLPVLGQHNVLNALAATTATLAVGINLAQIKQGLESMRPVAGRLVPKQGLAGIQIFDDTYNANPFSVSAALHVLAQYPGERIFIMGDMGELGATAEEHHRAIGKLAKQLGINKLYACGRLSSLAVEAFGAGAKHFATQSELSAEVCSILHSQMTVLVKGSRSAKMENVVAKLVAE